MNQKDIGTKKVTLSNEIDNLIKLYNQQAEIINDCNKKAKPIETLQEELLAKHSKEAKSNMVLSLIRLITMIGCLGFAIGSMFLKDLSFVTFGLLGFELGTLPASIIKSHKLKKINEQTKNNQEQLKQLGEKAEQADKKAEEIKDLIDLKEIEYKNLEEDSTGLLEKEALDKLIDSMYTLAEKTDSPNPYKQTTTQDDDDQPSA